MSHTVIIENVADGVGEAQIRELLDKLGTVDSVSLARDDKAGSGQVAFVKVQCGKSGRAEIVALDGTPLAGQTLKVKVLKEHSAVGGPAAFAGGGVASRGNRAAAFGIRGAIGTRKSSGRGR